MHMTIRLASAAAAFAAAVALSASATAATTATGTANAEILSSLQLEEVTELDFGQIAVNGAGTVVIAVEAGVDQCTGSLICAGTRTKGLFRATGTGDVAITAQVLEASITLTETGGATMTFDNFTIGWPNGNTLDATTGEREFQIGGTLNVGAGQATGVYSGDYTVEVEYQ